MKKLIAVAFFVPAIAFGHVDSNVSIYLATIQELKATIVRLEAQIDQLNDKKVLEKKTKSKKIQKQKIKSQPIVLLKQASGNVYNPFILAEFQVTPQTGDLKKEDITFTLSFNNGIVPRYKVFVQDIIKKGKTETVKIWIDTHGNVAGVPYSYSIGSFKFKTSNGTSNQYEYYKEPVLGNVMVFNK